MEFLGFLAVDLKILPGSYNSTLWRMKTRISSDFSNSNPLEYINLFSVQFVHRTRMMLYDWYLIKKIIYLPN